MNKRGHVLNAVLLSIGFGFLIEPAGDVTTFATITEVFLPVVLGALFPDVDTAFGKHRKTLHNLPVLVVFLIHPLYHGGNLQWVWIGVVTHYLLDIFGSRRGIALFYPLSDREYGSPTGVTTSSAYSGVVTVVISVCEIVILGVLIHVIPDYLPPTVTNLLLEKSAFLF